MTLRKTTRTYRRRSATTNFWTDEQKLSLERMRLAGRDWPEVSTECQHPISSCESMWSLIRRTRRKALGDTTAPTRRKKFKRYVPPPMQTAPAPEPTGRTRHTSTLVQDAELRARIAIQGPNGLLGDPPPGRSALDQRRAEIANAPMERPTLPHRTALDQTRSSNA